MEDGVPKTYLKIWDPENEEWIYIPENEVPLWGPKTGDPSSTVLWGTLCLASLAGIGALLYTGKRRR